MKIYKIKTFEDLCNTANTENVERLSIDLIQWLREYVEVVSELKITFPQYKDTPNWDVAKGGFMWIDDGKNDLLGFSFGVKNEEE